MTSKNQPAASPPAVGSPTMYAPPFRARELWLADPGLVRQVFDLASRVDPMAAVSMKPTRVETPRKNPGKVRVIPLVGLMTKRYGWLTEFFGGTSTAETIGHVRRASRDDGVGAILILVDSGGGQVTGTDDLYLAIREAAERKPVVAFVEDFCASAAYYVVAGATKIVCNESAEVGSLGVFLVVDDYSAEFERAGIKVHVISTGTYKGMGAVGAPVTDAQIKEFQRLVDAAGTLFLRRVTEGRKLTMDFARKEIFDGRLFTAREAKRLRLVDEISTFEKTIVQLGKEMSTASRELGNDPVPVKMDGDMARQPEPDNSNRPSPEDAKRAALVAEVAAIMASPADPILV